MSRTTHRSAPPRPRTTRPARRFAARGSLVLVVLAVAVHALVVATLDLDPAAATLVTRRIALAVVVGLVVLWVVIVPLSFRLGRDLRAQADALRQQRDELRAQRDELQRLLDREQTTVRRLQEVDLLRDQFLESVSHELRTPVTVVTGMLGVLTRGGDGVPAETRLELLERALEKARRLEDLVVGLLAMNGTGEDVRPSRELVALDDAVLASLAQLPPRAVELDLGTSVLDTNRIQLVRTLAQLIGNALRHAPDDDHVVVRTRLVEGGVELSVVDHGPGVPDALKQAVFDPFRQGESRDAANPGIGMGLPMTARFAADHGGRAWIEDTPGGGCTVRLLLPDALPAPDERGGPLRRAVGAGSAGQRADTAVDGPAARRVPDAR